MARTGSTPGRGRWRRAIRYGGVATLGTVGLGFGTAFGSWTRACAGGACPSIAALDQFRPVESSKIYAADGRLIADLGTDLRTVRSLDEVTPALQAAFVASEDKRFYQHSGIDFRGIPPAFVSNAICLCFSRGFSTITMQLARNVFPDDLPRGKTIHRKIREMKIALELERTYPKDRILEMYLNQIFLGRRFNGVEAAAQGYFGKSASELNVAEAALLAGMAPEPNSFDPDRYPDRAVRRRNVVLNLLRDQGFLDSLDAERWKAHPLELNSRTQLRESGSYFVEWVRRELFQRFGQNLYERGYRVYTTIDLEMQAAAERALIRQITRIEDGELGEYDHTTYEEYLAQEGGGDRSGNSPYLQGALVALDVNTGYVRAMVGGRDFGDSEFNRATQAERQPGSSFKAFVYTAAIRAGRPASYIIDDRPISIMQNDSMPWEPVNFEGDYLGPMTIRGGLRRSRNLVAILLGEELGVPAVRGEAVRFGISTRIPQVKAMYIGAASVLPIEMVSAYGTFASLGERATPIGILRVEDEAGNIVLEPQVRRDRILDPARAWILNSMFRGVVDRGSGASIRRDVGFRHPAGGKTGTTNDGRDVWFLGFTSEIVAGVWIGFDRPQKIMQRSSGGRLAAPVWGEFMKEVYERRPAPPDWERPAELITREVDNVTGYLATEYCPRQVRYFEWYVPGTEPKEFCPYHTHAPDEPPPGVTSTDPGSGSVGR